MSRGTHLKPLFARFSSLLGLAVVASACATVAPPPDAGPPAAQPGVANVVWQRVRFRFDWDQGQRPRWPLDALLAHRVAGPAVARERESIVLWRFHRRAAGDAAGHSLSLLTYAPRATNDAICRALQEDRLVAEMTRAGLVEQVECEGFPPGKEHLVEATSDARWSVDLQRAWPYYIMGASEMWLRLIDEHARRLGESNTPRTLDEAAALYETINGGVTLAWRKEGEHAFLHHLNALFGYEEIEITEKRLRRF